MVNLFTEKTCWRVVCVYVCDYTCVQKVNVCAYMYSICVSLEAQLAYATSIIISCCSCHRCHSLHNPVRAKVLITQFTSSLSMLCVLVKLSILSGCADDRRLICSGPVSRGNTGSTEERRLTGEGLHIIQFSLQKHHNEQDDFHILCCVKKTLHILHPFQHQTPQ